MPQLPERALADAVAHRDARRFCDLVLPAVSRTFAIGIRALPGDLGRAVLTAYLICRLADTVEDAPGMTPAEKAPLFEALLDCFDGQAAADRFPAMATAVTGDPAHLALVRHADLVFAHFLTLPTGTRRVVRHWVTEMVTGMRKFVELYPDGIRIQTVEEFREYCYYVAGTVGYLLTDLWHEHSPAVGQATYERLRERCRAFGEALQTVNILKDVGSRRTGRELDLRPRAAAARAREHACGGAGRRVHPRDAGRRRAADRAGVGRSRRGAPLPAAHPAAGGTDPALLRAAAALRVRDAARPRAYVGDAAARRRGEDLAA